MPLGSIHKHQVAILHVHRDAVLWKRQIPTGVVALADAHQARESLFQIALVLVYACGVGVVDREGCERCPPNAPLRKCSLHPLHLRLVPFWYVLLHESCYLFKQWIETVELVCVSRRPKCLPAVRVSSSALRVEIPNDRRCNHTKPFLLVGIHGEGA